MNKITKINSTEIEIEEPAEKYRWRKSFVEKRLAHFKSVVVEYQNLLKEFDK